MQQQLQGVQANGEELREATRTANLCRELVASNNTDIRQEISRVQESLRLSISSLETARQGPAREQNKGKPGEEFCTPTAVSEPQGGDEGVW